MATAIGSANLSAAAPASASASRISSVAYATDESASEENTARATRLLRRWWIAAEVRSGRPMKNALSWLGMRAPRRTAGHERSFYPTAAGKPARRLLARLRPHEDQRG